MFYCAFPESQSVTNGDMHSVTNVVVEVPGLGLWPNSTSCQLGNLEQVLLLLQASVSPSHEVITVQPMESF